MLPALLLSLALRAPARAAAVTVVAVGDVMLGWNLDAPIRAGVDPFGSVGPVLRQADLAFANLEGPMTGQGKRTKGKKFTFRTPPARIGMLKASGLDAVGLANNHTMDFGLVGLMDTLKFLDGAGIEHAGAAADIARARAPAMLTAGGQSIAFLDYNLTRPSSYWAKLHRPGTAVARKEDMVEDVRNARAAGARVIVMLHWGQERSAALFDYQRPLARALAGAGAELVLGTHPHVAQGVERIGGTVIAYSLGDAVFGGNAKRPWDSLVLRATLSATGLARVEVLSLNASRTTCGNVPAIRTGPDADPPLAKVRVWSAALDTNLIPEKTAEGWPCLRVDLSSTVTGSAPRGPVPPGAATSSEDSE